MSSFDIRSPKPMSSYDIDSGQQRWSENNGPGYRHVDGLSTQSTHKSTEDSQLLSPYDGDSQSTLQASSLGANVVSSSNNLTQPKPILKKQQEDDVKSSMNLCSSSTALKHEQGNEQKQKQKKRISFPSLPLQPPTRSRSMSTKQENFDRFCATESVLRKRSDSFPMDRLTKRQSKYFKRATDVSTGCTNNVCNVPLTPIRCLNTNGTVVYEDDGSSRPLGDVTLKEQFTGGEDVTLVFCIRRAGCGSCREHALQLSKLARMEQTNIFGILKEINVEDEALEIFHRKYFHFPLYKDGDWTLFKDLLGDRKLTVWKMLKKAPALAKRYSKKEIENIPFGGDLWTKGKSHYASWVTSLSVCVCVCVCLCVSHYKHLNFAFSFWVSILLLLRFLFLGDWRWEIGGVLIFDRAGTLRFVYFEQYGDELDEVAIRWGIDQIRKANQQTSSSDIPVTTVPSIISTGGPNINLRVKAHNKDSDNSRIDSLPKLPPRRSGCTSPPRKPSRALPAAVKAVAECPLSSDKGTKPLLEDEKSPKKSKKDELKILETINEGERLIRLPTWKKRLDDDHASTKAKYRRTKKKKESKKKKKNRKKGKDKDSNCLDDDFPPLGRSWFNPLPTIEEGIRCLLSLDGKPVAEEKEIVNTISKRQDGSLPQRQTSALPPSLPSKGSITKDDTLSKQSQAEPVPTDTAAVTDCSTAPPVFKACPDPILVDVGRHSNDTCSRSDPPGTKMAPERSRSNTTFVTRGGSTSKTRPPLRTTRKQEDHHGETHTSEFNASSSTVTTLECSTSFNSTSTQQTIDPTATNKNQPKSTGTPPSVIFEQEENYDNQTTNRQKLMTVRQKLMTKSSEQSERKQHRRSRTIKAIRKSFIRFFSIVRPTTGPPIVSHQSLSR